LRINNLDAERSMRDPDGLFDMIEDIWNYFPHRSLRGGSPGELLVEGMQPATDPADMTSSEPDPDKIDKAVLALLLLGLHEKCRAWKGHDWDVLDRLHAKGYISDPVGRAKSVVFTEEGLRRLFCEPTSTN
jgi:hypothetical protein